VGVSPTGIRIQRKKVEPPRGKGCKGMQRGRKVICYKLFVIGEDDDDEKW
jgi:hypothetical protein